MNRFDRKMIASYVLILAGTSAGIVAASRTPVHTGLFLLSASAAGAGVILNRTRRRRRSGRDTAPGEGRERVDIPAQIASLLEELRDVSGRLGEKGESTGSAGRLTGSDAGFAGTIAALHAAVGDAGGGFDEPAKAHLKVLLSEGERYVNRTWSALSDGYSGEALRSITAAIARFEEFERLFREGGRLTPGR